MGRVKDYHTFLKENKLLGNIASKQMTRILDPDYESKARTKTQAEVESSFGTDANGNPIKVMDSWKFDDKKNGFVGIAPMFSGEVILKEIDNEGDTFQNYKVTSGINSGLTGKFTWAGNSGVKYPEFGEPEDKKWSDILGPTEDFLKTCVLVGYRWASIISEIDGVKLKKVGLDGVYEIEYEDKFQFYGNVRIYYSGNNEDPNVNSFYSYEVKDGPNKGTKGKGFQIFTSMANNSGKTGIYNPFSNGDGVLKVIQYPAISHADREKNNPIKANTVNGGTGIKPDQLIFLKTSDLSSIKGPTPGVMFDELNFDYGSIPDYNENKAKASIQGKEGNKIFGKIQKSKLPSTKIFYLTPSGVSSRYGKEFAYGILPGIETNECYISCYQGQPLILYTVKCEKKDSPSFDSKGVGTYGNRYFSGIFYDHETGIYNSVFGEWYYDYFLDEIGIIYAYGGKEIKQISNMVKLDDGVQKELDKLPWQWQPTKNDNSRIAADKQAKFDAEVIRSRHKDIGGF